MSVAQGGSQAKRSRVEKSKIIGTHNGTFHCDEALAVFLLKQTTKYRDSDVTRTRQPDVLDTCDIVVDVGAVYDESQQRFDHHQREFTGVFGHGFTTKLSSAGLVYKHFGKEVIANVLQIPIDDPQVDVLWLKLYKEFIEAIDGIDNGVSQFPKDIAPKYRSRTDLSSRVGWLNPAWNEPSDPATMDKLFAKASELTGKEFTSRLTYYGKAWLPAREVVVSALAERSNIEPSGRIVVFEKYAPWKEHLFELESELNIAEDSKPFYIIYPDETGGAWRIQAVPETPDSFESRKALPKAWRGVRDNRLSEVTGIPGCVFAHASGFIGGNISKEGALAMARAALVSSDA